MASARAARRKRPFRVPPVTPLLRASAVACAFALAIWGFSVAYGRTGRPTALGADAYRAVQLIVGRFPNDLDGQAVPWTLQIARWALPLLTFWSTIALGWVQIRNPLRLAIMRARGEHLVIAGDAGLAGRAASGELADGARVLLWPADRHADWVNDAVELGAARVEAHGETLAVEELGLDKARGVLLLAPDDSGNTALASRVMAQAALGRPPGDPLSVIARIDNLDLRRSVEERFDRADRAAARIRFASLPDIGARALFVDRPIDGFRRSGDPGRRIFVFGYSPLVERYLLRLLAGGHFRDGVKPLPIVVDPHAGASEAAFRGRNPGADALSPIRFEDGAIDQPRQAAALVADLTGRYGAPAAIVVDTGDDATSLALALAIDGDHARRNAVAPPIHVHLESRADAQLGVSILAFGGFADVAGSEMLLQERHDALARSIHDFYLEGRLNEGGRIGTHGAMREWEDLPESFRDDNRLVADCYRLKLRDIGARLVDGTGPALRFQSSELEELARAEHDRWMAAKLSTGWVHGPTRDDGARHHPDIVPYDDLSEAIKDLDREQIRVMTRLLGATGQRALRVLGVALEPDGGLGLAAGLAGMMAQVARHYPDRAPLVTGALDDPQSRAALLAAFDAGDRVRLIVHGNIQLLIDALAPGDRNAVCAMVRGADTILAIGDTDDVATIIRSDADLLLSTRSVSGATIPVVTLGADGSIRESPWHR